MFEIQVQDINGKVATSIDNEVKQIYNTILKCSMFGEINGLIKDAKWFFDDELKKNENHNYYTYEFHTTAVNFVTMKTGTKKISLEITFIDDTFVTKEIEFILINRPN